jgi:hypothetical protein
MKKLLGSLFGLALAFLVLPMGAEAMTILPPSFDIPSTERGDAVMDVIRIVNESKQESVTLYPSVENFTDKEGDETVGTPFFYSANEDPYGTAMAKWIAVDDTPITLGPNETKNLPFTINVPNDATPGGHFGVIILGTQPPSESGVVGVGGQVGVLIMLRVNGDVKEVGGIAEYGFKKPQPWFNHLPVEMFVRFENRGNVHLRPTGNIFVTDWTGRQVASLTVNEDFRAVLPMSIRRYDATWVKSQGGEGKSALWNEWHNFAIGRHKAQLVLTYGLDNKTVTGELAFYVWPWRIMLIVLGALAFIVLALTVGKRAWVRSIIRKYERQRAARK